MARKQLGSRLSERSLRVYEFIVAFKRAHDGLSPTYREICEGCGFNSTSYVRYLLDRLIENNLLAFADDVREAYSMRSLVVVGGCWTLAPEIERQLAEMRREANREIGE